jgi:hypothetical protein
MIELLPSDVGARHFAVMRPSDDTAPRISGLPGRTEAPRGVTAADGGDASSDSHGILAPQKYLLSMTTVTV